MSARIIKFPPRGPFDVILTREGPAWLVTAREHGWLCDDRRSAIKQAHQLAQNFGIAVREVRS